MPQLKPSPYQEVSWESEEEEKVAKTFSPINLFYLNDLRFKAVQLKLNLKYDPEHQMDFVQQEAYLQAQINLLNSLIGDI